MGLQVLLFIRMYYCLLAQLVLVMSMKISVTVKNVISEIQAVIRNEQNQYQIQGANTTKLYRSSIALRTKFHKSKKRLRFELGDVILKRTCSCRMYGGVSEPWILRPPLLSFKRNSSIPSPFLPPSHDKYHEALFHC